MNSVTKNARIRIVVARPIQTVKQSHGSPSVKRARFDTAMLLSAPGAKAFTEVKDGSMVVDIRDVTIKGYLSTFNGTDRQGDTVLPGAFRDTIARFMQNPRLLIDHRNSAEYTVGSFTEVREDGKGLYVEARLSNSPGEICSDIRWKVAEGHVGALSMGGYFHYNEDGRTIGKVDLYEGSLVAVPANPECLFSVRAITQDEEQLWAGVRP